MTISSQEGPGKNRHVVLVAYYFPPMGGSGVQRVAKWVKYLPDNGWNVTVLTVEPGRYLAFDDSLLEEIERPGIRIIRTRSLDPTRGGGKRAVGTPSERKRRLFTWLTGMFFLPDNKRGWARHARSVFEQIRASGPVDVVLSSAPPYTGLMVGGELAKFLDVPHVVDYRDDWLDNPRHRYPSPWHRAWHARAEKKVLTQADLITVVNESIKQLIQQRAPEADIRVLPQGYDPADFGERVPESGRIRLVYSGMFYDAQQPDSMLRALAVLAERDQALSDRLELRFVGLFPDEKKALVSELGLEKMVTFLGYRSHAEAVAELQEAHVLWVIVGRQKGGHMIATGKLFEYMGSRRPILALAPEGEVRSALKGYGASWIVDPDDVGEIASSLASILKRAEAGQLPRGNEEWVSQFDRKKQAHMLSGLLTGIADRSPE